MGQVPAGREGSWGGREREVGADSGREPGKPPQPQEGGSAGDSGKRHLGAGEPVVCPVLGSKAWEPSAQVLPGRRERRGETGNPASQCSEQGGQARAPRRAHGNRGAQPSAPAAWPGDRVSVSLASFQRVDTENRELSVVGGVGLRAYVHPQPPFVVLRVCVGKEEGLVQELPGAPCCPNQACHS